MSRVYMFNPLITERPGPMQQIIVNADSARPYSIRYTYLANTYVPLSTDGARIPGSTPSGNAFCDSNQLVVKFDDDEPRQYHFDLPINQGDAIAYFFRNFILLLTQDGTYQKTYCPDAGGAQTERVELSTEVVEAAAAELGSVFVFNVGPADIKFSANGGVTPAKGLKGWADTRAAKPYTPAAAPVPRVQNQSEGLGKIFLGNNKIMITPENGSQGTFTLPAAYSINQDLFLYLLRDRWLLLNAGMEKLDGGMISPRAEVAEMSISAEE